MTSSDMPIVISDDEFDESVPEVKPPKAEPAPKAKSVPEVKPPKAKPVKRKRVSEGRLLEWSDICQCVDPDTEYWTCRCEEWQDFVAWEKKCTCEAAYRSFCKCPALQAPKKK